MVPSECTENAALRPLVLWICTKKILENVIYKNSEYYLQNLANANCIKLVTIANLHSYSLSAWTVNYSDEVE